MAKTRRLMRESLPLVDAVVELRDARVMKSSRNPEIDRLTRGKPRLILLNKADLADAQVTQRWCDALRAKGHFALSVDCRSGRGLDKFERLAAEACAERLAKNAARGMQGRPMRLMVVGIPNVGKSSFINRMAKSRRAKVEDRPGVTLGRQWVKLSGGMELLDMPGVLWPKFEDPQVGLHLAFTGAIRDAILDVEDLAVRLLTLLTARYPQLLAARYGIDLQELSALDGHDLLARVAQRRGMLLSGGGADTLRAAVAVLDEFRAGTIGRISLETPREEARSDGISL